MRISSDALVNEADPRMAAKALGTYYEQEKVKLSGTLAELGRHGAVLSTVSQLKHRRVL